MRFNLVENDDRREVFSLISAMRNALAQGSRVVIDFSRTRKLSTDGTLLFSAALDAALEANPGRINCTYPADNTVEQLFQHIGLLERMGRTPRQIITEETVRHWHFVKGATGDAAGFTRLLDEYQSSFDRPFRMGLYGSLSEAVTNTIQHAYPNRSDDEACRPWWMFAQRVEDELTIAICDLGIGIAESLKRKPELKDILLRWRHKSRDRKLIEAATGRRSSTKLPYRGRGLPEMLEFVRTSRIGGMIIHSNGGTYGYDVHSRRERAWDMAPAFPGTLILWTLSVADMPSPR